MPTSIQNQIVSGLCEGQVLQRDSQNRASTQIRGTTPLEGIVLATLRFKKHCLTDWKRISVGKASRGRFKVHLDKLPAGGPYTLTLEVGTKRLARTSFYVGDVWLLAGQSNMEGVGEIGGAAGPHPLIRLFSMRRQWRLATEPLHVLRESPDFCHHGGTQLTSQEAEIHRHTCRKGVGVGLFFALEMLRRSRVPQGLIATAHGGTSMTQWSPELRHQDSLYASMLTSVRETGQKVAGMLWYQGESDTSPSGVNHYTARMEQLVSATRKDLRQPRLPWITVQLGRVVGLRTEESSWNLIQEQQRLLPTRIKHLDVVPAVDLTLDDPIHIGATGFPILADRMARVADRLVYPNSKELPPPNLDSISRTQLPENTPGPKIAVDVVFQNIEGELQAPGEPTGFRVHDANGNILPILFKTTLRGNVATLHLATIPPDGFGVSYGHGLNPVCNLHDSRNFSLPVFTPQSLHTLGTLHPFLTDWHLGPVQETHTLLGETEPPALSEFAQETTAFPENGFVDQHAVWQNRSGLAFFRSHLRLRTETHLEFWMGYDGPFRLWINGTPFYLNSHGVNPCLPDESAKSITLPAGNHCLIVGMDICHGKSWGFFLRFRSHKPARKKS